MRRITSLALTGAALLALGQPASAMPIVAVSLDGTVGAGDIVCGDGSAVSAGVICASGGSSSTLVFNSFLTGSTFGSFGSIALTAVDVSAPGRIELDQNSIEVSGGAGDLYLFSTQEFDFGTGDSSRFTGAIGGTTDGTVSYEVFVGTSAFSLATRLLSMSFAPGGADSPFSGKDSDAATLTGSLWLTQVVRATHTGGGMKNTSSNATIKVSEPGPLALLGLGLVAAGFLRRRTAQV
jgi:hypothetical protein